MKHTVNAIKDFFRLTKCNQRFVFRLTFTHITGQCQADGMKKIVGVGIRKVLFLVAMHVEP